MTQNNEQIIQTIVAPQCFGAGWIRQGDCLIVMCVIRRVAPSIQSVDGADGLVGFWLCNSVRAIKDPSERKTAYRCGAVSLAFVGACATMS